MVMTVDRAHPQLHQYIDGGHKDDMFVAKRSGATGTVSAAHTSLLGNGPVGSAAATSSIISHVFAAIPLFRSLTKTEQAVVASSFECEKYSNGGVILDGDASAGPAIVIGACC